MIVICVLLTIPLIVNCVSLVNTLPPVSTTHGACASFCGAADNVDVV